MKLVSLYQMVITFMRSLLLVRPIQLVILCSNHTTGNATDGSVVFKYFECCKGFTTLYKVNKGQIEKKYDGDLTELAELGKTVVRWNKRK